MTPPGILLVALPPTALELARQAAQAAFPQREVIVLPDLHAALQVPPASAPQLLVLGDPGLPVVAEASQVLEKTGLPRWAIVAMGAGESDVAETVPMAEWSPPLLARVFRATLLQHELLWENLRLRGDMKTVARRVSHDMRTPIGCIYTTADMLPELDAASLVELGGVIKQSAREISQIIDRVGFVLQASVDSALFSTVKMGPVVEQVLKDLDPAIKKAGAVVVPPVTWPEVIGVVSWLQVIWRDLLDNALQHGGPAPRITLTWERTADSCRFAVTDNGSGVSAGRLAALFGPFDQLHDIRESGIGLAIVHRLTSLQGGSCGYEKTPQGGACFHFTIPVIATGVN
ncbi:MAG TPA: HAMP domain-containing sensor histidine kinase [Lacunisphaera sp.]